MPDATNRSAMETQILKAARRLFEENCDWVTFYRQTLGTHGMVRQHYQTPVAQREFEQTAAYEEIQRMLRELRQRRMEPGPDLEPTRVITVRLPKSLHEALRNEAFENCTSMNKLCISKLMQIIDSQWVPSETPE